jgi:hypothetical protein
MKLMLKSVVEIPEPPSLGVLVGAQPHKLDVMNMIRGAPFQELKVTRFPSARKIFQPSTTTQRKKLIPFAY